MYPTRVFILASRPLFAQGVESLLSSQPGIEVVGVAAVDPDVFAQVQAAAPDVVIVEAKGGEQSLLAAQVLDSIPAVRVVGLSLEDNRIHTYYQQMKHGRRVEDLLEAVREPVDWHGLSPEKLHLFVSYQGNYGQRILGNIQRYGPETWMVERSSQSPSSL
jgi:chemotaxis response regulator CheB